MGQRHQAFLIAKVVPHGGGRARYRCIAALHHQWCYGTLPVRAVIRLLALLRQPGNAQIVKAELADIAEKYGGSMDEKPPAPRIPCPFSAYLLNVAFNCDIEEPYASGGSLQGMLDAKMNCWGGHNNDGITVVDVTDPLDPAYGHLFDANVLSGFDYAARYYEDLSDFTEESSSGQPDGSHGPNDDGEESDGSAVTQPDDIAPAGIRELLAQIKTERVIPLIDIIEAWPKGFKPSKACKKQLEDRDCVDSMVEQPSEVPSLMSLTIGPSVRQVIESGDLGCIEAFFLQKDKVESIVAALRELPAPFPDTGLSLIKKIVDTTADRLDLSHLQLSAEQLGILLTRNTYDIVDLSHNSQLTCDTLPFLLAGLPPIRRLFLLGSSISCSDMNKLLIDQTLFRHVQELIHSATHHWAPRAKYPAAFMADICQSAVGGMLGAGDGIVSLPLCSPVPIAQNLISLLELLLDDDGRKMYVFDAGLMMGDAGLEALFGTAAPPDDRTWREREVWCTPCPPSLTVPATGGWRFLLQYYRYEPSAAKYGFVRVLPGVGRYGWGADDIDQTELQEEELESEEEHEHEDAVVEDDDGGPDLEDLPSHEEEGAQTSRTEAAAPTAEGSAAGPLTDASTKPTVRAQSSRQKDNKYPENPKKTPEVPEWFHVHDLAGFLAELEKEGKPPLPSALAGRLAEVFGKLAARAKLLTYHDYQVRLREIGTRTMMRDSMSQLFG
ncbi:hypothetical protein BD626DRAFT_626740 [Schizophyllum amplum]|uniref:Uncharacterized protein n=1 Tax=Schizophyllum amplum TaxID=97359 RepID=A0A550CUH5_9AGAR|nr:hypothetical protein BD626DRAFT_626740 [Auriculariopsis ampla]